MPLTSCNKDDENGSGNGNYSTLIIGKWKCVKTELLDGEESPILSGNDLEFRSDKICIINSIGDHPYSVSGNKVAITIKAGIFNGSTFYYTIISLTRDKLVIEDLFWEIVCYYERI